MKTTRLFGLLFVAAMEIGLSGCSTDEPQGGVNGDDDDGKELLVPAGPAHCITPKSVLINGEAVMLTPELLQSLRDESLQPSVNPLDIRVSQYGQVKKTMGKRALDVDSIAVYGPIDESDFDFMRHCVAEGSLRKIDLRHAELKDRKVPDDAMFCGFDYIIKGETYNVMNPSFLRLYSLALPDNVEEIGERAFTSTLIRKLELPQSIKKLGEYCYAHTVFVTGEFILTDAVRTGDNSNFAMCGDEDFVIVVPGQYKVLYPNVFGTLSARTVILSEGVEEIAENALSIPILEKIVLPNTLRKIHKGGISGIKTLKSISLPASIEELDEYSLIGLSGLESIYCYGVNPNIAYSLTEDEMFEIEEGPTPFGDILNGRQKKDATSTDAVVYVPEGCKEKYEKSIGWAWFIDFREM